MSEKTDKQTQTIHNQGSSKRGSTAWRSLPLKDDVDNPNPVYAFPSLLVSARETSVFN